MMAAMPRPWLKLLKNDGGNAVVTANIIEYGGDNAAATAKIIETMLRQRRVQS